MLLLFIETKQKKKIEKSEISLILTDWFHADAAEIDSSNPGKYGGTKLELGTAENHCLIPNRIHDHTGVKISTLCHDSILVNGFGHFRHSKGVI